MKPFLFLMVVIGLGGCNAFRSHVATTAAPIGRTPSPLPSRISNGYVKYNTDTPLRDGAGTVDVSLGSSRRDLLEALGTPNESYEHSGSNIASDGCGPYAELHWIQTPNENLDEIDGDGVFCYLRDDKTFQVSFSGKQFVSEKGAKFLDSEDDVKKLYRYADKYLLTNSGSQINGGKDLVYLVDNNSGIAFEFSWDHQVQQRVLWTFYVFTPGTGFVPTGCLDRSRKFVRTQ